jgi:protein TonB
MFEQSLMPSEKSRTWTLAAALLGQLAAGGVSDLLPLVKLEPLPCVRRAASLAAPLLSRGPAAQIARRQANREAVPQPPKPVRVVRQFDSSTLTALIAEPQHAAINTEADPPPAPLSVPGPLAGVPYIAEDELPPPPPPLPAEAAQPPEPQRIRVGGRLQAARLVHRVVPMYPPLARQAHVQGTVELTAVIGKDGRISELHLVSGNPLLVQAAMDAVKQWRYTPTYLNDAPVEVSTNISVIFTLH